MIEETTLKLPKTGEKLVIRAIREADLRELWEISNGPKADLKWREFNGPYFEDPILNWVEFLENWTPRIGKNNFALICLEERIVGILTSYWEDGRLEKWLEFGIVIYDATLWSAGIGSAVVPVWLRQLFKAHPDIPHIGFTTWSGNFGMMKLGEKCGMQQEDRIRKVRFWQGQWFDSVKYGILREELEN